MNVHSIEEIKSAIEPIARSHNLEKVCLFGSYARGDATESSDMDFLIYGFTDKGYFDLMELHEEIGKLVNRSVDVIRVEHLREKLKSKDNELTKDFIKKIKRDLVTVYERA
jgi:hypothetical protein